MRCSWYVDVERPDPEYGGLHLGNVRCGVYSETGSHHEHVTQHPGIVVVTSKEELDHLRRERAA